MKKYLIRTLQKEGYSIAKLNFIDNRKNVELELEIDDISIRVKDEYPFFAFIKIRSELESYGIKMLCNGSRIDVYPSGNSVAGIMAYELEFGKPARKLVCIFDPFDNPNKIGTVNEQKMYR